MTLKRIGTVVVLVTLLSTTSCDRFGSSNVAKPTQVVDFPSMAGKSLQEMTTMLGPATERALCYGWELPEGDLTVCYGGDNAKRLMSSISYELKPDRGVGSLEEMMALVNINVQGKEAKEDRRGFFTYNFRLNDKSCFVDIHPRGRNLIFGPRDPVYKAANLYIQNPHITLYPSAYHKGNGRTFYEPQTNINLSVGSVTLGHGNWEVCTEVNFTGKCKLLDGVDSEYLKNRENFSAFGLGETIRSFRPVEEKVR
jgi:hypothetical protein